MTCPNCSKSDNITSQSVPGGTQYWCSDCNYTWVDDD